MIEHLHPILASFIFPFLFLSFVTEVISYFADVKKWQFFTSFILIVSAFMSIAAYYAGFFEFERLGDQISDKQAFIESHQLIAKIYLISLLPTTFFVILRNYTKSQFIHWIFVIFLIISIILGAVTSREGGHLVFTHGIGVKTTIDKES